MLTLFSTPKAFSGHNDVIQRNALKSWTLLGQEIEIILLGDDPGTAEAANEFGVRHIGGIACNEFGTPLVDSIFSHAQQAALYPLIGYVNADIILMDDFLAAVKRVTQEKPESLIVGRRWNLDVAEPLDFSPSWQERLRQRVNECGQLFVATGIDYFVFNRGLFGDIPPFAIGRTAWDNWLLYRARASKAALVDATDAAMVVHQNHDYNHHKQGADGVWHGPEAQRNLELAGGPRHTFSINDRTHQLTANGLKRSTDFYRVWRMIRTAEALNSWLPLPVRLLLRTVNKSLDIASRLGDRFRMSEKFEVPGNA